MTPTNPPESKRDAKYAVALAAEQIRADSRRGYEQLVRALIEREQAALARLRDSDPATVFVVQGEARAIAAILKDIGDCEKITTEISRRRS